MARPVATEEEQAAQRKRLRLAASELYREGGLGAITVRAVAKRAGVSTGLLYSYYADRSELMRSMWTGPIAKVSSLLANVEQAENDPVERIRQLLLTFIEFSITNPDMHRALLLFVRPPNLTTDVSDDPEELQIFASLRRSVQAGQAAGTIRDGDARVMAQLLWSGVHGALALPINVDTYDLADGPTVANEMISVLVRSITTKET